MNTAITSAATVAQAPIRPIIPPERCPTLLPLLTVLSLVLVVVVDALREVVLCVPATNPCMMVVVAGVGLAGGFGVLVTRLDVMNPVDGEGGMLELN